MKNNTIRKSLRLLKSGCFRLPGNFGGTVFSRRETGNATGSKPKDNCLTPTDYPNINCKFPGHNNPCSTYTGLCDV